MQNKRNKDACRERSFSLTEDKAAGVFEKRKTKETRVCVGNAKQKNSAEEKLRLIWFCVICAPSSAGGAARGYRRARGLRPSFFPMKVEILVESAWRTL